MARASKTTKAFAKHLYVSQKLTQKEVAERTGVTEKTIGTWVNAKDGEWKKLRKSTLVTKTEQLARLYQQLDALTTQIKERPTLRHSETLSQKPKTPPKYDPIVVSPVPDSKEGDTILKLTKAIKELETETSIAEIIEVARSFVNYLRPLDLSLAQEVTDYFDSFIKEKMR